MASPALRRLFDAPLPPDMLAALSDPAARHLLLDVEHIRVHHANVWVLAQLLRSGGSGIIVCVDQPADFILRRLEAFGIDRSSLWALEMFAGTRHRPLLADHRILQANAPFAPDLTDRLRQAAGRFLSTRSDSPGPPRFLLLDNIATLDAYLPAARAAQMVGNLEQTLLPAGGIVLVPLDIRARPGLRQMLAPIIERTVSLRITDYRSPGGSERRDSPATLLRRPDGPSETNC